METSKSVLLNRRDLFARALPAAAGAAAFAFATPSIAETAYPSRPIKVIVPFAAGGPSDIIARILAEALYQPLGQSVVIENRAGGGANIGIGLAARAEPDGYTLLVTTSAIVINPSLYKRSRSIRSRASRRSPISPSRRRCCR